MNMINSVDEGCYYHEAFLRGMPELTCFIRRLPQNVGKSTKYPQGEPGELFKTRHTPGDSRIRAYEWTCLWHDIARGGSRPN